MRTLDMRINPILSQRKKRSGRSLYRENRIYGLCFLLPAVVLYGLFVFSPIFQSLLLSFQDWDGFSPVRHFVGLTNYINVLQSSRFWTAFTNNIIWSIMSIFPIVLGLLLAVTLFQKSIFGNAFFRTSFLLPYSLSHVVSGIIWSWIYQPDWGTINTLLRVFGLKSMQAAWLGKPGISLIAANLVGGWTWYGFCMVIFLAGLQSIDENLYEAARIDGANDFQILTRITVPLLGTHTRMLSIITVIFSFKVFDLIYVLTGGGPFQTSEVLGLVIYIQGFSLYKVSQASSTAMLLTLVVFVISVFSYRKVE